MQHFDSLTAAELPEPPLRQGGVYVVTGGLGGLGLHVAEHLAREYRARLILLGRSASGAQIPARLRDVGGEVVVRRADVADQDLVAAILQATQQRFGVIHGVVHAAGVAGGGLAPFLDHDDISRALRAKVVGTRSLFGALREVGAAPDFVVLFSSLAALSGAPGQIGYAAANAFLDTYAGYSSRDLDMPTLSINWDRWRGLGMAAEAERQGGLASAVVTAGLDPATALTAFRSCLAAVPLSRVVVSTLPPDELGRAVTAAGTPADDMLHAGIASGTGDCATPENSLERDIAMIWEEALGVTEIGAHDNFFTLGGHSVLALQIVQRCKERLNLAVTVHQLFTNRTIAGLVQALTKTASQSSGLNS